jgi:hypothetical protein
MLKLVERQEIARIADFSQMSDAELKAMMLDLAAKL